MTREEQVEIARAQIEMSQVLGISFITVFYDGVELPCLKEIADNLCVEQGQEMTAEQMQSLTRAHILAL